jgi:hypothetical protein
VLLDVLLSLRKIKRVFMVGVPEGNIRIVLTAATFAGSSSRLGFGQTNGMTFWIDGIVSDIQHGTKQESSA